MNSFFYSGVQRFSPNTVVAIDKGAKLKLGKKVRAHTGTRIRVRKGASVIIGNDVAFSYNCLITAHNNITVSDGCEIGPGVLFYDHDHDVHTANIKDKKFNTAPVYIGKNVWIGANVIVLRGAHVGDNCVIAAGTVVKKGNYENDSLIYNKKETITRVIN